MATIEIRRVSEWNNHLRDIELYLDGKPAGSIANGEKRKFTISPGMHKLQSRIDWCGSPEIAFTVAEDEVKVFELSGFKLGPYLWKLALISLVAYFLFNYLFDISLLYLLVPQSLLLLYLIYYFTFGRNNYLRLQELTPERVVAVENM